MAHTPGPWFVGYSPEYDIDTGDDGQTIGHLTGKDEFDGTVFSVRMLENGEEELVYIAENIRKEETANLIAAAPELLETSEALLDDVRRRYPEIETNGFSCPFFRAIEQAIKKAKGVSCDA